MYLNYKYSVIIALYLYTLLDALCNALKKKRQKYVGADNLGSCCANWSSCVFNDTYCIFYIAVQLISGVFVGICNFCTLEKKDISMQKQILHILILLILDR